MTDELLNEKIRVLRQNKWALEECRQRVRALEEEIQEEMTRRDTEQIVTENYKVTWKWITSTRLDAKALKQERPELYQRYAVESRSRRFVVT